jgi:hypothetical protein
MTATARSLFLEELEHWFRSRRKPKSSSQVMAAFGTSYAQTLAALGALVEEGVLVRTGLKRGTRYAHHLRAPQSVPQRPQSGRWHERVRDVAVELGTFRLADVRERLPDLSTATLHRWLLRLVADGVLTVERVGKAHVYSYAPLPAGRPETSPGAAPRARPGRAVPGTGRRGQSPRREVRDLLAEQRAKGRDIVEQKHGYAVVEDGQVIAAVPRTASDHRSLKNVEADLKRHDREGSG